VHLLTLDFETYYDKEYSLKKMTPAEYILDARYETICVAVQADDGPIGTLDAPAFTRFLAKFDPKQTVTLTFNSLFDNCILAWRYGFVPARMIDGLGIARYSLGHKLRSLSLENVAKHLGLGEKGHELTSMLGVRRAQLNANLAHKESFYGYAAQDVRLLKGIFKELAPQMPASEMLVMDLVLRAAVCPVFKPNIDLLKQHHKNIIAEKDALYAAVGLAKEDIRSDPSFVAALQLCGVEVEMKVTEKGNLKPALSKTDNFVKELQEHDDPQVQALVAARLGARSTLEEARTERFIRIAELDWPHGEPRMPIPLRYSGAHTRRLSGDWRCNLQNLPAGRGGKSTALRDSLEAPEGYEVVVGDLGQIEARLTAWLTRAPLLEVFAKGLDPYKYMAATVFGVAYDQVTPDQRQIGKAAVLGLGFGLGAGNFYIKTVAAGRMNGQDITSYFTEEIAKRTVHAYRASQRPTVEFWELLNTILQGPWLGLSGPVRVGPGGLVEIGHGYCKGPGGISMLYGVPYGPQYPNPLPYPRGRFDEIFFEHGGKRRKIYGAAFLENLIQFLARIVIFNAAIRMHKLGYNFAHQCHDELVYVVRKEIAPVVKALLRTELTRRPSWAMDLPLKADVNDDPEKPSFHATSYGMAK
jgi:DNA polymerase